MMEPVAWMFSDPDGDLRSQVTCVRQKETEDTHSENGLLIQPLVRLSDAEARIAELIRNYDDAYNRGLIDGNRLSVEQQQAIHAAEARAEAAEALLKEAFLRGFMSSAEGYNGEYPFDLDEDCLNSQKWVEMRDRVLSALKEKP